MYLLSEEETNIVYQRIKQEDLNNPDLLSELLDHICCIMETAMSQGIHFEEAYKEAYLSVCPNGFREIEEEVFFLLKINKQLNMKKMLFSSGFITTFILSFGFLFKLMHWPMASHILLAGFATLVFTITCLAVYFFNMTSSIPLSYRFRIIIGLVCGLLMATGSMFKILQYPGASLIIVLGMILLNLVFLPLFFYQLYKKSVA